MADQTVNICLLFEFEILIFPAVAGVAACAGLPVALYRYAEVVDEEDEAKAAEKKIDAMKS